MLFFDTDTPSTADHNYGNVSTGDASRLAALLVGQMLPAFFLLAPGDPGASPPEKGHLFLRGPLGPAQES